MDLADSDGSWSSDGVANSHHQFVDVRILPLSPIPRDVLRTHPALRGCELIRSPQPGNLVMLSPDEVAALDGFDLTTTAPIHRRTAIEIEPVPLVYGDDEGTFMVGDTDEGSCQVIHEIEGEDAEVLGQYDSFSSAIEEHSDTWSSLGKALSRSVPARRCIGRNPATPLATVHPFEDLSLALMKGSEDYFIFIEVSAPEAEDAEVIGEFDDLGDELLTIAEHLATPEDDEDAAE